MLCLFATATNGPPAPDNHQIVQMSGGRVFQPNQILPTERKEK